MFQLATFMYVGLRRAQVNPTERIQVTSHGLAVVQILGLVNSQTNNSNVCNRDGVN